jgi:hypothetical protein
MSMGTGGAGMRGVATQECRLWMAARRRGLLVEASVVWRAGTSRKEARGLRCWGCARGEEISATRARVGRRMEE